MRFFYLKSVRYRIPVYPPIDLDDVLRAGVSHTVCAPCRRRCSGRCARDRPLSESPVVSPGCAREGSRRRRVAPRVASSFAPQHGRTSSAITTTTSATAGREDGVCGSARRGVSPAGDSPVIPRATSRAGPGRPQRDRLGPGVRRRGRRAVRGFRGRDRRRSRSDSVP